MPAVRLWGRRWHFSSDVVPLPAFLSGVYHLAWIVILLVGAIATGQWPGHCQSHQGVQYLVVLIGTFSAFCANLVIDALLLYNGLKGSPFQIAKRWLVEPLLYAATAPLALALALTAYGSYVATHLEPDCWPLEAREGVKNLVQGLVGANWGFFFVAILGIIITYNLFAEHGGFSENLQSWEARWHCIATLLCCRRQMLKSPDGKRPPLRNIAELTAGLFSHVDLDPTDMAAALVLTSAAQNRRRRLRIAKALLPVYKALRSRESLQQQPDLVTERSSEDDLDERRSTRFLNDIPADSDLERELHRGRQSSRGTRRQDMLDGIQEGNEAPQQELHGRGAGERGALPSVPSPAVSLPLTEDNVAVLDAITRLSGAGAADDQARAAAGLVGQQILHELPERGAGQGGKIVSQLADAIVEEISHLGGEEGRPIGELVPVIQTPKEPSLDLEEVTIDPSEPAIWFPAASSRAADGASGVIPRASPVCGHPAADAKASAGASPFAAAAAAASSVFTASGEAEEAKCERIDRMVGEGATVEIVPADGDRAGRLLIPGAPSQSGVSATRQITLKYPKVITPSEHVDDFRGPLPAEALADIYAGRHEQVPAAVLKEASHFMRYSYAVYSLEPKIDQPPSLLDIACWRPPSPEDVIFKGLNELQKLESDSSIEVLHLNCSNRVLSHLPYMIALDHAKKAVVIAIKGTISVADLVTDSIVYPEPLEGWLPESVLKEVQGPVFAHAGMVAAARAIFQDMTERGILVEQETRENGQPDGGSEAPQQQDMERPGGADGGAAGRPRAQRWRSHYNATEADQGAMFRFSGRDQPGGSGPAPGAQADGPPPEAGSSQAANVQAAERPGEGGRLWRSQSSSAIQGRDGGGGGGTAKAAGEGEAKDGVEPESAGRRVGCLIQKLLEEEGWQLVVQGHSLGGGAAALISLKLLGMYPGLKCLAYSCPGGLVSKNLAHAMAGWCTTVAVGKDAVPRMTVSNLGRLMDEMVTSLARCKQPKVKVLLAPWWRRHKQDFRRLFYRYNEIPREALETLERYHASRTAVGQPLAMFPPGRLIFCRPIKTRSKKEWDAVWISPEDLIAEGLLISRNMTRDHQCAVAWEAINAAAQRFEEKQRDERRKGFGRRLPRRWIPRHKRWTHGRPPQQHEHTLQEVLVMAE